MADGVVRALTPDSNLKVIAAVVTGVSREARARHGLRAASASLLAQGIAAGALMASLQKGETRINLQLECDGPLRGFLVDAAAAGDLRGYVKNPDADVVLQDGAFRWRAALGNSGFLSVLRDVGGEYYRSSVQLQAMDLAQDLNHYFERSDQVPTRVALALSPRGAEDLGVVCGVLVQALPDGDRAALATLGQTLDERVAAWAGSAPEDASARGLLAALLPGLEVLLETPVTFACTCSRERAIATLEALGVDEVQHIVDTMGSTAITCHFCGARHEVTLPDLFAMLERLGRPQPKN